MNGEKKKLHYAWKIAIACALMKMGSGGAIFAAIANFVAPITAELGCTVSQLTTFNSINAISMALLYTTAAKYLTKKHVGLVMGIASIFEISGLALMSTYHSVYMFYFSAVMIGVAQSFTGFVSTPILLNMWFKKKGGTVLGTVMSIGTVSVMLYSMLSAKLISAFGWRSAYLIMALIAAVLTLPAVFLLIKTPEEVGCKPYGAEDEPEESTRLQAHQEPAFGLSSHQAFRMPLLYVVWFVCIIYSFSCGISGYGAPFATLELGCSIEFGAMASVFASMGGAVSSLLIGKINDRFGVKSGLLWGSLAISCGYMIMFLSFKNALFIYPAIFITGMGTSMYGVQCPLYAQKIVGSAHYPEIWARMMMINSLIGGGLYSTIGLFYDKFGSFRGAFMLGIVLYLIAGTLGAYSVTKSEKMRISRNQCPA